MFGNILSSLGFGGATVDTVLDDADAMPGETLRGEVRLKGGTAEQDIRGVVVELVTRCLVEGSGDQKHYAEIGLASATLSPGRLGPGESRSLPLSIAVPAWAPLSVGSTQTVLRTRLEVARAVDPTDSDRVRILPTPVQDAVFRALESAGFRLVETEVEYRPRRQIPFAQEFDFRPTGRGDWGIQEVEIAFTPAPWGTELLLTVDRRGGFFAAGGERTARLRLREADLHQRDLAQEIRRAVDTLR